MTLLGWLRTSLGYCFTLNTCKITRMMKCTVHRFCIWLFIFSYKIMININLVITFSSFKNHHILCWLISSLSLSTMFSTLFFLFYSQNQSLFQENRWLLKAFWVLCWKIKHSCLYDLFFSITNHFIQFINKNKKYVI